MPSSSRFGSSAGHSLALLRLAFATASPIVRVNLAADTNSLAHYAKGTQSGIPLSSIALLPLVGTGFQILFHSPNRGLFPFSLTYYSPSVAFLEVGRDFQFLFPPLNGVLFTFPSRYYALSVTCLYLVLDDGPPGFSQGSSSPMILGIPLELIFISPTGLSPTMAALPRAFDYEFES